MIITRCIAFNHSEERPREWMACKRRTRCGDQFCTIHRDALDGAILGLLQWEQRLKGTDRENNAYLSLEKAPACKTCGARHKWKIPNKRARKHLLNRAGKGREKIENGQTIAEASDVATGGNGKTVSHESAAADETVSVPQKGN
jgi:hypothetical protein